jgi:hypothetical protein
MTAATLLLAAAVNPTLAVKGIDSAAEMKVRTWFFFFLFSFFFFGFGFFLQRDAPSTSPLQHTLPPPPNPRVP